MLVSSATVATARAERVIVAFGTSLTARGSWPDQLVTALKPCLGDDIRLERIAAVGKGSEWGLGATDRVIAAKPNVVLIEFAINDADIFDGVSVAKSKANHMMIIAALRNALPDASIALVTTNPALGLRSWIRPHLKEYYELYRKIADDRHIMLIDTYPMWQQYLKDVDKRKALPDGLHPTNAATERVALPLIESAVLSMLKPQQGACG